MYAPPVFSAGDTIDRYEIESLLGRGGMGLVYRARDTRLGRHVALKVVRIDDDDAPEVRAETKARLLREARAVAALEHPGAVGIFDVGEVDGTPYIAMELIRGRTLRAIIDDKTADLGKRLRWLRDIAEVLSAAHAARLVHRDIKPENVMVREDGMVKVLDFGIARRQRGPVDASAPTEALALSTLTSQGVQVGTPMYMAPEQIRGETLDGRTDQFAWGVVAYELLSGRTPWKADDALRLVAAILTDAAPPLTERVPDLPPAAAAVVAKSLAKSPDDRYADMKQLIAALDAAVGRPSSRPPQDGGSLRSGGAGSMPPTSPRPTPRSSSMVLARYTREEIADILERALLRQQAREETFSHYELLEAAAEIGVDPHTLQIAARELAVHDAPSEARRRKKQKLKRHFAIWAAFSVFFFLIDAVSPGSWWFFYPVLAWGVAIGVQLAVYLSPVDAEPKRRRRPRGHRVLSDAELEAGVREVLGYTAARRRFASTPPASSGQAHADSEGGRRPASGPASEEQAEIEAMAEADADAAARARR